MPVCTSIHCEYPPGTAYAAPKKYVLVLSCVDCRLLDDLIRFLDHDNLTNRYYHVALAGAALGVVPRPPVGADPLLADVSHWRKTFVDQVRATVELTHGELTDIYIVQHEHCGAFRLLVPGFEKKKEADQLQLNYDYALALVADLCANFCCEYNARHKGDKEYVVQEYTPAVHAFYMDLRGNVRLIPNGTNSGGIPCSHSLCHCAPPPEVPTSTGPSDGTEQPAEVPAPRGSRRSNK